MTVLTLRADRDGERADALLTRLVPDLTRSGAQRLLERGAVTSDGKPVRKNDRPAPGDVLEVALPDPEPVDVVPQNIPLDVVYEDGDVIVVNKPAGLVVHPGHGNWTGTLVNALAWHFRDTPDYDVNDPRLGLVHRIDKDTSGLLVIAKTPEAKTDLGKQFFNKTTRREYVAMIWGSMPERQGTITGSIARNPRNALQMAVMSDPSKGKHAVTHYEVLEDFGYVSIVKCVLETGRTHQIRVHFQHKGHPLFNDERYGGHRVLKGTPTAKYKQFVDNCFELCPRQALHARTLGFRHPETGKEMDFEAPLPPDMENLFEKWRRFRSDTC